MVLKNSKSPLYYQLAEIILSEIESKNLKENDKLLTEREYAKKYELSRATVRQALAYLEEKGYVYKIQGCGTFVSSKVIQQKLLKVYSFTEEMKKLGKIPESKILSLKKIVGDEKVAKELNLNSSDEIFELERLRIADREIIMYERTYMPVKKMPNLSKKELLISPLYDIIESRYKINFNKVFERFSVLKADESVASILQVNRNSPLIKLQRWTYSGMEIIEYTISLVRGDRFEFEVELEE